MVKGDELNRPYQPVANGSPYLLTKAVADESQFEVTTRNATGKISIL